MINRGEDLQDLVIRRFASILLLVVAVAPAGLAQSVAPELAKTLPRHLNGYRQFSSLRPLSTVAQDIPRQSALTGVEADFVSLSGRRFTVELIRAHNEAEAYGLFTFFLRKLRQGQGEEQITVGDVGTASAISPRQLVLFKGRSFLRITQLGLRSQEPGELVALARLVANPLDPGDGDIPVLVKHLPDWQTKEGHSLYVTDFGELLNATGNQQVFQVLAFEGGAQAVIAPYETSQLVVIEFSTPQLAGDNDRLVSTKLKELWQTGQPAPTAYRRVGNYLVFVLNAESVQAANQLIDQVKYEQVVQWLGENPYLLLDAQRQYTETTLGVFVAVVKASALALLICLGVGGLFGGILFTRRRARQKTDEAFSDAGGMLRLNLDEMTPQTDPSRLLGRGN
ncbi:MAG TPA: DUF6599 family protein [Pyrinomonadaceae bacterium]|nr:DUF6599 family protein [Pyrinomonadaceae bacterium]